jgi:hypothetical protein
MKEKVSKLLLLSLTLNLILLPLGAIKAKKPLEGTMDLEFNLGWPAPQDEIPDWVGTITIDGEEYKMLFFAIGSGKAFDEDPGKVHFFEEIWAIYDTDEDLTLLIPSDSALDWEYWLPENDPEELILWGYDKGQTNLVNSDYHMNGNVEEAFEEFSVWEGRNVHMSGVIEWYENGAPNFAPGTFRIN